MASQKQAQAAAAKALKKAAAAAAAAAKKRREQRWKASCIKNRWQQDPSYRQPSGTKVVHRDNAMKYFVLSKVEIDTLPYIKFPNRHHDNAPAGKSYEYLRVLDLVHRKHAYLARCPPADGEALFDAYAAKLDASRVKCNRKVRKLKIWRF